MSNLIPRGVRNNNPGNIRHSKDHWMGQSSEQKDDSFITFDTPVMGIRCAMKILQNYYQKYKLSTPWEMISRWAPPSDNNPTDAYAAHVATALGVGINDEINLNDEETMIKLVQAIVIQENGKASNFPAWINKNIDSWYTKNVYEAAWSSLKSK